MSRMSPFCGEPERIGMRQFGQVTAPAVAISWQRLAAECRTVRFRVLPLCGDGLGKPEIIGDRPSDHVIEVCSAAETSPAHTLPFCGNGPRRISMRQHGRATAVVVTISRQRRAAERATARRLMLPFCGNELGKPKNTRATVREVTS
ncbi:hypothetical protein [Amycolatopsis sp. cmx-11-32]|uniref:hypothetical protein n=1 Tax=Amycolatopsis sp. cmx-11-32 TaxID=2785796 RepID=UPI0039E70E78